MVLSSRSCQLYLAIAYLTIPTFLGALYGNPAEGADTVTNPVASTNKHIAENNSESDKPRTSINLEDAQAIFAQGVALIEQNKKDEAIKVFVQLTKKYPSLPEPYNNLAVLYAEQGQYDLARKTLEMAIKTHPSYATAHENLGDIYARMASEAYDKALQLDSGNTLMRSKFSLIKGLFNNDALVTPPPSKGVVPAPTVPNDSNTELNDSRGQKQNAENTNAGQKYTQQIEQVVKNWASAWEQKDVETYLKYYAENFQPAGNQSIKSWRESRRIRISKRGKIKISIQNLTISLANTKYAQAKFRQLYTADGVPRKTLKTLYLIKKDEQWFIEKEVAS